MIAAQRPVRRTAEGGAENTPCSARVPASASKMSSRSRASLRNSDSGRTASPCAYTRARIAISHARKPRSCCHARRMERSTSPLAMRCNPTIPRTASWTMLARTSRVSKRPSTTIPASTGSAQPEGRRPSRPSVRRSSVASTPWRRRPAARSAPATASARRDGRPPARRYRLNDTRGASRSASRSSSTNRRWRKPPSVATRLDGNVSSAVL
jgi:hypothetical protein